MHRFFARSTLLLLERLARRIDPHQILRREKSEGRMLPGDQKLIPPGAATQITAPAADEPALEELLAPLDYSPFQFGHFFSRSSTLTKEPPRLPPQGR